MRVFVVGTGRCGTKTFSMASRHIANYTSGHETRLRFESADDLSFPDNHIEVNAHLTFLLGPLIKKYPNALYVHLWRKREDVVRSWIGRGLRGGPGRWAPFSTGVKPTQENFRGLAELCYDQMVSQIDAHLGRGVLVEQRMGIELRKAKRRWPAFWKRIGAEGNHAASLAEWDTRHNASRRRG